MVSTPLIKPLSEIQLAKANHPLQLPDAYREDALLVAISREGTVFFGNTRINPADLTPKIRERMVTAADKRVFVKADARAHYKAVAEVVDDARSAGVSQLGLLTEARRNSP